MKRAIAGLLLFALAGIGRGADAENSTLARNALAVFEKHCHRCHGESGALEGGMNYVTDLDKLMARRKVVPGKADDSPLFKKLASGKMPPPGESPRPSEADIAAVRKWIDAGAPGVTVVAKRPFISEGDVFRWMLADLDKLERRSRRFVRYFSLVPLANAGLSEDELQTYRNALAKLVNALSWHPKITVPVPADPGKLLLRIDLRDVQWDANLWNRVLTEYPYGVFQDTATARACSVATATRMPVVRADWFIANASRPPLYQDLLQLPTSLTELERQLRVDVQVNLQQERVARAGFNGSGISRNNRLIERHDAVHGAYWRTYDFDAVPQNLIDRQNLIPDRRNLFAYPLGPGIGENVFQHAGGEAIFNLPNGLHAYMLVNANNQRIDKGPIAIVSDPKRPDRAVETGVSCMNCHYRGILPKADQIRDYVSKNPKAFSRADAEIIRALYVPEAKMKALMDEDAEKFAKALAKTGNKVSTAEPVMAVTLRYEADVDLPTLASECGLPVSEFQARVAKSELLAKNLGSLRVAGGTVARQVVVQSFGDIVKELKLGLLFQSGQLTVTLPDNTGEIDPLEAQSSIANSMAFMADGKLAAFASADKSVRFWDVEAGREIKRTVGHSSSVWAVALSRDGRFALSGSADTTVRGWDTDTGREILRLEGHTALVTCVAISPEGRFGLSGGYDHALILWDLEKGQEVRRFEDFHYVNAVAFVSGWKQAVVAAGQDLHLIDTQTGKVVRSFEGHTDTVTCVAVSPDGKYLLTGSDDRTVRLWEIASGRIMRSAVGHSAPVHAVAFSPDGTQALSGGADRSVRLWDVSTGQQVGIFTKHEETVVAVAFTPDGGATVSGSRDGDVRIWKLKKSTPVKVEPPTVEVQPIQGPEKKQIQPAATVSIGGTVTGLFLSPDGKQLFYLNASTGKLGRIDTGTLRRDPELALADGAEVMSLSRDGKLLYAASPAGKGRGQVEVIDPEKMTRKKTIPIPVVPYDLAARDDGIVFVSGVGADWTDVTVLDTNRETVLGRWGGMWTRSFVQLSPKQDRLYVASQGVTPGTIEAFALRGNLGDKPAAFKSPAGEKHPIGGEFVITPDGRFLLCKNGTVLRLSVDREEELQFATRVEPFVAAVVEPGAGTALLIGGDGTVWQYGYPEWKKVGTQKLPSVVYQAVCDAKAGRVYVAGFDPKTLAGRPRAHGVGEVQVYEMKGLLTKPTQGPTR